MTPLEQGQLFDTVIHALGAYTREPNQRELEGWWLHLKAYALRDVERALRAHEADEDDGKRAPRPVDVKRRLSTSGTTAQCAARDGGGRCEYPGIFADATDGRGAWFCPWHREERAGSNASQIIAKSTEVAFETAYAKRIERIYGESARSPAVVNTAHAIALRHGDKPWRPREAFNLPGGP